MADCKKCGKPIKWSKSREGQFIPMEKNQEPKEYLMVVDYEENDRGWKTPIVETVKLYEAHRQHCDVAKAEWASHESNKPKQDSSGFSLSGFSKAPEVQEYKDDDLPF